MSVISFDIEEHNNAINDEKEESLINNNRYEVKSLNPSSNQINFENPKNKKKMSISVLYFFIFINSINRFYYFYFNNKIK